MRHNILVVYGVLCLFIFISIAVVSRLPPSRHRYLISYDYVNYGGRRNVGEIELISGEDMMTSNGIRQIKQMAADRITNDNVSPSDVVILNIAELRP